MPLTAVVRAAAGPLLRPHVRLRLGRIGRVFRDS